MADYIRQGRQVMDAHRLDVPDREPVVSVYLNNGMTDRACHVYLTPETALAFAKQILDAAETVAAARQVA